MHIELKLLLDRADVAGFRRLALIGRHAAGKPSTERLTRIYFDTPRLHLREHGVDLHLCGTGSDRIEILQADRDALAGLHYRRKWEAPVDGPRPDLGALVARIGQSFDWIEARTAPAIERCLVPIFECDIRRTAWLLLLPDHARIELRLDEGELRRGYIHEPICEVELELKAGDPATLFALALQLQQTVPLRVGNLSKADRGYSLIASPLPVAVKARPMELTSGQSVEQAFRAILINCLVQMQDNEAGVIGGTDPESLHQMRVGMRRLRSAQRLFAKSMRLPDALRDELDWLAGELGAARDLDVLADGTLGKVASACPQEAGLPQLRHALVARAAETRRQAAASVGSARYSRMMMGLVAWLQDSGWRASLDDRARLALARPLDEVVEKVLARRHRKLLRYGKRLQDATPRERHRVRIAAKQARYATEFLRSLLAGRRVKRYLRRLNALQDALGWINDAAVADKRLSELGPLQPGLRDSAAFARGFLSGRTEQDLRDLKNLWKAFRGTKPPPTRR
jgi:inorganic triphosphatase YgiF